MTMEAIKIRETFKLGDLAGVALRREKGDTIYRSTQECPGIIINVTSDFNLQTDITYAPGAKITNYICYPGGGCWVRWFETKEFTYNWIERLEPTKDFNTVDDIERRTDLIEYAPPEKHSQHLVRGVVVLQNAPVPCCAVGREGVAPR